MKLKNFFFAITAVAGLAALVACSSDKLNDGGEITGSNEIAVTVTLPQPSTRGVIDAPVGEDVTPEIENMFAYIMKGNTVFKKQELKPSPKHDGRYIATFVDVALSGG